MSYEYQYNNKNFDDNKPRTIENVPVYHSINPPFLYRGFEIYQRGNAFDVVKQGNQLDIFASALLARLSIDKVITERQLKPVCTSYVLDAEKL